MATNLNLTPSQDLGALAQLAPTENTSALDLNETSSVPANNVSISSLVDPRKVYLAQQNQTLDGLNDYEKDFASKSFEENYAKYGEEARIVDNNIANTAARDSQLSYTNRTSLEAATDTAITLGKGFAEGGLAVANMANMLNPVTYAVDKLTGSNIRGSVANVLNSAQQGIENLAEMGYSDVENNANLIKGYKNSLDEARYQREYDDAVARGESAFGAGMAQFAKGIYSGLSNALTSPTAWTDAPAELLGSVLAMGATGKVAKLAGSAAKFADTALTRAVMPAAERASIAARATAPTAEEAMGLGTRAAEAVTPIAENAAVDTALSATNTAGKGALEKLMDNELVQVGLQEGGSASLDAYDSVMKMSDEELTDSSDMYRQAKDEYLAQGLSEEEAETKAKQDVANSASTRAGIYNGLMAAPMGKLMPKGLIKDPIKTFFNPKDYARNVTKETFEEGLENLGAIGGNEAARETYNNDQDILEGVAQGIGEGAASAGLGTAEMGAKGAFRSFSKSLIKGATKLAEGVEETSAKKAMTAVQGDIDSAISNIRDKATNTDASVSAVTGTTMSTDRAERALNKFKDATTPLTEEQRKAYSEQYGFDDAIGDDDTKLSVYQGLADDLAESIGHETDDGAKLYTLRKLKMFSDLHNDLFGDTQSIDDALHQVDDEGIRDHIRKAYAQYQKLGESKAFRQAEAKANAFAKDIISGSDKVLEALKDASLSDSEREAKINTVTSAFQYLFKDGIATNEELAHAKHIAETAQATMGENPGITSFLDEINTLQQNNARNEELINQEKKFNEEIAAKANDSSITADTVAAYRAGNKVDKVAYEKLSQLLGEDSAKQSYQSVLRDVMTLRAKGPEGTRAAKHRLYKYMNFVQSQINKLNAYKQSHDDYLADRKANPKAKIQAKAKKFTTYNPEDKDSNGSWYESEEGIYAGNPALGANIALEAMQLKQQFDTLSQMYFKDEGFELKGYDQKIVDDLVQYHDSWVRRQRKSGTDTNNDDLYNPNENNKDSQEAAQQPIPPADNTAPVDNNNNQQNPIQQPTDNNNQNPADTSEDIDFSGFGDSADNNSAPDTGSNQSQQKQPDNAKSVDNSNNQQPVDNTQNQQPKDQSKPSPKKDSNPFRDAAHQNDKADWRDVSSVNLKQYIDRVTFNKLPNEILSQLSLIDGSLKELSEAERIQLLHRTIAAYNKTNADKALSVRQEQYVQNAVNYYLKEKTKQNSTESSNSTNTKVKDHKAPEPNLKELKNGRSLDANGHLNVEGLHHIAPLTEAERNSYRTGTFAGVGSRKTPVAIQNFMKKIASKLEANGLTLRSGGADGADSAFESGIQDAKHKEIYEPKHVNDNTFGNAKQARAISEAVHPVPHALKSMYIKNLMARNGYQILGSDLSTPCDFVLCYAPLNSDGTTTGGTGQAVRLATLVGVPVFNLAIPGMRDTFDDWFTNTYLPSKNAKLNPNQQTDTNNSSSKGSDNTSSSVDSNTNTDSNSRSQNELDLPIQDNTDQAEAESFNTEGNVDVSSLIDSNQQDNSTEATEPTQEKIDSPTEDTSEVVSEETIEPAQQEETSENTQTTDKEQSVTHPVDEDIISTFHQEEENTSEQDNSQQQDVNAQETAPVEAYNSKDNQVSENASKQVKESASRFHHIKSKCFSFTNERFGTRESTLVNLNEIANHTEDKPGEVTAADAKTLIEELSNKAGSFYSNFRQKLIQKLSAKNPDGIFRNDLVEFPVQAGSYVETLWKSSDGSVNKSHQNKITYGEALTLLSNPSARDQLSEREISKLMELFPTLICVRVSNSGALTLDEDLVTNMAMNALAIFNSQKDGSGYDWQRIADDLGMDLNSILAKRNTDKNGKVISTGADFLTYASSGMMLTPMVRMLNSNVMRSLGLKFNENMAWETQQHVPNVLTSLTVSSLSDMGLLLNQKFEGIGNGITIFHNTAKEGETNALNNLTDPAALNKYLANDRATESGDVFVRGKTPKIIESTHNTYENTNIPLTQKGKAARDNYEKVEYRIDEGMAAIYDALANEEGNGLLTLYGDDVSNQEYMDSNDLMSKKGANLQITKAWEKFTATRDQMRAIAQQEGVPLSEICKRYRMGITSVNRIQELESYGPIANKLMREVMLSTWNKINLNSTKHMEDLARAVIQNFGGKLNKKQFKRTKRAFNQMLNEITTHPDNFTNLMTLVRNPKAVNTTVINAAHKELADYMKSNPSFANKKHGLGLTSVDKNFMGLHAMQTLAMVANAKINGKSEVETSIYCEADGTTNGTINTQFLMTDNIVNDNALHLIDLLDKGGMRLGDTSGVSTGSVKDGLADVDADVYGMSGGKAKELIQNHLMKLSTSSTNYSTDVKWPKGFLSYINNERNKSDSSYKNFPGISVGEYTQAVQDIFRFSGLTSNGNTTLEQEISRNFMKSPCTKGMYGAGLSSIINTFLFGDRNVPGVINKMYEKHTDIMKALHAAEKPNGEALAPTEAIPIMARAAFKGIKGAENWDDNTCIQNFNAYLRALNILTNCSLYHDTKTDSYYCKPTWAFNSGKNISTSNGFHSRKFFDYESFLQYDENGVQNNKASLNLSEENIQSIFNGVKSIYGDQIYQAVTDTIRAANVNNVQDLLLKFAGQITCLNNIIALNKLNKFKSDKTSIKDGKSDLADFNDKDIGNILDMNTIAFQLGWQERRTKNELKGGSLSSARDFGRYSNREGIHSRYNLLDESIADVAYNYLENPGVRILPNMAISMGDGDMMGTAMAGKFLEAVKYATTLIFDGGNAAVGMMHDYGKLINEIQYNTDMRNIMEPVLQKILTINETLKQQFYSERGFEPKQILKSDIGASLSKACSILNFIHKHGILSKDEKTPDLENSDALLTLLVQAVEPDGSNYKDINAFIQESADYAGVAKYNSVYSTEDFSPVNFDIKNLRKKANQQVFAVMEHTLGTETMKSLCTEDQYIVKMPSQEAFKAFAKVANLSKDQTLNSIQLTELDHCLQMVFGTEYDFDIGLHPEDAVQHYLKSFERIAEDATDSAKNISLIQSAKYCMGGTYDHMASHDSPHVVKPTKEEFKQILAKFNLKPKDGLTVDELWKQLMEDPESPNEALEDLRLRCTSKAGVFNAKKFCNKDNFEQRGKILQQFVNVLTANCDYVLPEVQSSKVAKAKEKTEVSDEEFDKLIKHVKVISAEDYLNNNSYKNSLTNGIKDFFGKFKTKFINSTTSIAVVTGETCLKSIDNLASKYKADVARYNAKVDKQNAEIKKYNETHKNDSNFKPKKLKEHYTPLEAITRITEHKNFANKYSKEDREAGKVPGMQFYDPVLNRIYIMPSKPDGLLSKAEEDNLYNVRLPHELIHMCLDKAINELYPSIFDSKLSNKALNEGNRHTNERTLYAVKALQRLNSLKQQIDVLDLSGLNEPSISNYIAERDRLVKEYSQIESPEAKMQLEAKMLQEFVAYFGTLSDDALKQIEKEIRDKTAYAKQDGTLTDVLQDLTEDTIHEAGFFSKIVEAVKSAFTDFISKFMNIRRNDPTIRMLLSVNSAIIDATYTDNWEEYLASRNDPSDLVDNTTQRTSFLTQTPDPANSTSGSGNIQNGSVNTTVNTNNNTSQLSPLEKLSNAVTSAVEQYVVNLQQAARYKNPNTRATTALRRAQRNDFKAKMGVIFLKSKDPNNVMDTVIKPLQQFGLQTGDDKAFCNIVNGFMFVQGMKSPLMTEVNKTVKKVLDKLSVNDFSWDPSNPMANIQAQNFLNFIQGIGKDSLRPDQIAPVMLALSQTDPDFRNALSKIDSSEKKSTKGYLLADKFFNNLAGKVTQEINKFKGINPTKTASEKFDQLVLQMAKDENIINKTSMLEGAIDTIEGALNVGMTKLAKAVAKAAHTNLPETSKIVTRFEANFNNLDWVPHFAKEFIHDLVESNKDNVDFYAANTKVKTVVQQTRENAVEKLPILTKEKLPSVTEKQWSRLTKAIGKTSLASLFVNNDITALTKLVKDNSHTNKEIAKYESIIGDKYRIGKCKQLANYMMTGKAGKMLLRNPVNIAKGFGLDNSHLSNTVSNDLINACDKLSSLYALQMLSQKERKELGNLLTSEPEGMSSLMMTTRNQYKDGLAKAKNNNKGKYNWIKGAIPWSYESKSHLKVAPLSRRKELERLGYKFVRNYDGSNLDGIQMGVFHSTLSDRPDFNPGAIQMTGITANGINVSTGLSTGPNGGMITGIANVKNILNNMGHYSAHEGEDLVPLFDAGGNIYGFERTIDPALLNDTKYIEPVTDYAKLLGIQEGRNIEEKLIQEFNTSVVDLLHNQYEDGKNFKEKDFVNLYEVKDPTIKNIVQMLPRDVKSHIEDLYGKNTFYVLRSEVNDVIGYHSASITDSWTGETRLPPAVQAGIVKFCETIMGDKAFKYLKTIEDTEQDIVKAAKNAIIIRSVVVPTMNLMANAIQLWVEGVPLTTIAKESYRVTKELQSYTTLQTQLLTIEQELKGTVSSIRHNQLSAQKRAIDVAIKGLTIYPLIEAGEFSSIADLGNTARDYDFSKGGIGDRIIEHIDNLSQNEIVRLAVHYGMVTPDTSMYKFLEKTNQYGDFLGKAILYRDLVNRRGWTPEEAHLKIKDEFVDYNRLPGRGRDYLERAGLLWFYNFKLRMAKVAAANLKEHPLRVLALSACGMPTPLTDSLPGKLSVLSATIGPGMMTSLFTSNPWVALLGLLF